MKVRECITLCSSLVVVAAGLGINEAHAKVPPRNIPEPYCYAENIYNHYVGNPPQHWVEDTWYCDYPDLTNDACADDNGATFCATEGYYADPGYSQATIVSGCLDGMLDTSNPFTCSFFDDYPGE